jgi:hypothetical protein
MLSHNEIQVLYLEAGLKDFRLSSVEDMEAVHGIRVDRIKGMDKLSIADRELLRGFLVNFMNRWGLEARASFVPIEVKVSRSKEAGRYLKFIYRMNDRVGWLNVKGVSCFY